MSKKPAEPAAVQLPADVCEVGGLRAMLSVPPIVHEEVMARLAQDGKLYTVQAGGRPLAGEADYLAALSGFCDAVPAVTVALTDNRRLQAHRAKLQAVNDGPVKRSLAALHGKGDA